MGKGVGSCFIWRCQGRPLRVTFEQIPEQYEGVNLWLSRARALLIAGTASTKVLRQVLFGEQEVSVAMVMSTRWNMTGHEVKEEAGD